MKYWWLVAFIFVSGACTKSAIEFKTASGEIWSTRYRVVYQSDISLEDSIIEVFGRIDRSLSVFNDSSIVSRVNRNEPVELDSVFQRAFEISKSVNRLTHGAFDPTVGPLIELYGFGRNRESREPVKSEIDSIMQFVGIDGCELENGLLRKKSALTTFNFSGIAKGYAADLIAGMLSRNGVGNFLVEIGGDIAVSGNNPDGHPWAIMLEPTQQILHLTWGAVATSGNYRKHNGGYGHIVDPRTGLPTKTTMPPVSVVAPTCILADAVATACMVADVDTISNVLIIRNNIPNDY